MSGGVPLLPLYAVMAWTGKLYLCLKFFTEVDWVVPMLLARGTAAIALRRTKGASAA